MKTALFPVAALLMGALLPLAATAQPRVGSKRPTPPMVAAARLKDRPVGGYLAHYLPDDRYKIAGGVWKFVSTDLDTYYHIPSSPNMMRQPAKNVIGFANARDAEEAGYVPDPTDGTAARRNAALMPRVVIQVGGAGSREEQYVANVTAILRASKAAQAVWAARLKASDTGPGSVSPTEIKRFQEAVPLMRTFAAQVSALRPPQRYARFHKLLVGAQRQGVTAMSGMAKSLSQGTFDLGQLNLLDIVSAQQELLKEAQRVGIDPAILR